MDTLLRIVDGAYEIVLALGHAWAKAPAVFNDFMLTKLGGVVSIVFSAFFFGIFGVFAKTKGLQAVQMDPVVFQYIFTLAIFASNGPLLFFFSFEFSIWGVLSGVIWQPSSIFSICAIVFLALSIGQSIWSGMTMVLSFFLGVLLGEKVGNWFISLVFLFSIVIALFMLSTLHFVAPTPALIRGCRWLWKQVHMRVSGTIEEKERLVPDIGEIGPRITDVINEEEKLINREKSILERYDEDANVDLYLHDLEKTIGERITCLNEMKDKLTTFKDTLEEEEKVFSSTHGSDFIE